MGRPSRPRAATEVKGIILAAGRGSRMRELTSDRPKCLVELAGRPLLDHEVASLRAGGISEIGIVCGWRAEMLGGRSLRLFDNPRWAETNMVASLACAGEWLEAGPCLISYSDIFYGASTVAALAAAHGDIAITFDPHWRALWSRRFADPLADAESFRRDAAGRVTEIGRRAGNIDEIEGQYMGLLKITPAGWAAVEAVRGRLDARARDRLDMTTALRLIIAAGTSVAAIPCAGPWGEVDSADDLALYERMVAAGELRL